MSLINSLDRTKFFAEFDEPLDTQEGVLSPTTQKTKALTKLAGAALTAAQLAAVAGVTPGTALASKAVVLDANKAVAGIAGLSMTATSASTSGSVSVEPFVMNSTMTGVGGVGGRGKFRLDTNVALGGWSNALKAHVVYGATGKTTGLGSAFVAEMDLSAGTVDGNYAPVEIELNVGSGASLGTATTLIYASVNGADKATFDTSGYVLNLAGVTAGTNKVFANNGTIDANELTLGLRVKIAGSDYYIPLATAANFAD